MTAHRVSFVDIGLLWRGVTNAAAAQPERGRFDRPAGRVASAGFWRRAAVDLGRRLVLAQTLIDDLAQQIVLRPGQVFDLGNEFGPHPMRAA